MGKLYALAVCFICLTGFGGNCWAQETFPSGHPENAASATWERGYGFSVDEFNIYIWRENYSVWVEIEPIADSEPYICSSFFTVIQDDAQYDGIQLEASSGVSTCYSVYISTVFELDWPIPSGDYGDLNQDFTLYFSGGNSSFTIDMIYTSEPPSADAGPDKTAIEGQLVTLDASNSFDPDNDPLTFLWTQLRGPEATLSDTTDMNPTFECPEYNSSDNEIVFLLTVEDGTFRTTDQVLITVNASGSSDDEGDGDTNDDDDGGGGGGCFIHSLGGE